MHIQSDRAFIPAGFAATRYLSITISAPAAAAPAENTGMLRPGVNVSLVLDRSGSMSGRKISLARQAGFNRVDDLVVREPAPSREDPPER